MSTPAQASTARLMGRIVLGIFGLLALMILAGAVFFFAGNTGGVGRVVVAALLSIGVGWLGVGYFRQLAHPPPPEAPPTEVHPGFRLAYVCEMCGMELAVVKVAKEKAPRHCGETMLLIQR